MATLNVNSARFKEVHILSFKKKYDMDIMYLEEAFSIKVRESIY